MLRKTIVLAMVIGVGGALALPTTAPAFWKHGQTPIQQNVQVGLTGQVRFQGGLGGIECQITSAAQFLAGQTTGNITSFTPHPTNDTTNCKGLGGLAFCQIHNVGPTGFPWVTHWSLSSIDLTHGQIHLGGTGGFCPVSGITITAGTIAITRTGIIFVQFHVTGTVVIHLTTSGGAVDTENATAGGTLSVESPNSGTYSA